MDKGKVFELSRCLSIKSRLGLGGIRRQRAWITTRTRKLGFAQSPTNQSLWLVNMLSLIHSDHGRSQTPKESSSWPQVYHWPYLDFWRGTMSTPSCLQRLHKGWIDHHFKPGNTTDGQRLQRCALLSYAKLMQARSRRIWRRTTLRLILVMTWTHMPAKGGEIRTIFDQNKMVCLFTDLALVSVVHETEVKF